MLSWIRSHSPTARTATKLYGSIVALARAPQLYGPHGAEDSAEGRFEVLALHLSLVLDRLHREGQSATGLGQALIEAFITDMDDSMREMGVGDLTVPRRVKKATAGLGERHEAYRLALADPDGSALGAALGRYLLAGRRDADPARIADHVRRLAATIAACPADRLLAGELSASSAPQTQARP